jgi:hypothetical protein
MYCCIERNHRMYLEKEPCFAGSLFRQNEMFLETSVILLKNYAEWIACNQSVVQLSIQYVLNSFSVSAGGLKWDILYCLNYINW